MDDDVKQLLLGFQSQIAALTEQNRELTQLVAQLTADRQGPRRAPETAPAADDMLVEDLWKRYFEAIADQSWAKNARSTLKDEVAYFGKKAVSTLRRPMWNHYRDHVLKKKDTIMGKPATVGTRNLKLTRFKIMFNWGVDQELISANPFARVKKEQGRPARETVIGDEDLERLLSKSDTLLRAFILVAIDSGMRKTEVRFIRWNQINDAGRMKVSWMVAKTRRSRSVRLSQRALAALDELPEAAFSPFVFANPDTNQPWSDSHMWQLFRDACTEAKISAADGDERVKFHDTRHSYITRTIQNGTPMVVAMRAAGHVTLRMASRYMHVDELDLDIMKDVNDKAIAKGPRRNPHRAHPPSIDSEKINRG